MQLAGSILTYVGGFSSSCMISFHDQFFDNPSALCLALWAKTGILLGGRGWGGGLKRRQREGGGVGMITKGVGLSHGSGAV